MNADRRAVLEAIAYGDDPDVRPCDRLRALEMMNDSAADNANVGTDWRDYVRSLSPDSIDRELDALLAGTVEAALKHRDETNYPALLATFERHVKRRSGDLIETPESAGEPNGSIHRQSGITGHASVELPNTDRRPPRRSPRRRHRSRLVCLRSRPVQVDLPLAGDG